MKTLQHTGPEQCEAYVEQAGSAIEVFIITSFHRSHDLFGGVRKGSVTEATLQELRAIVAEELRLGTFAARHAQGTSV